ncbi:MAG: DUF4363 family protein [Oscillospiraceae bacterium]|nr:DUF4363 family protein [Oscillospiraceae bacterium]
MKYLTIGVLILCLLVGLCWYSERTITKQTQEITAKLELALSALREGNEPEAHAWLCQASAAWGKTERFLASYISHDHTNKISETFSQLSWLTGHELGQRIEEILNQVRNLAEMERVLWKNIL